MRRLCANVFVVLVCLILFKADSKACAAEASPKNIALHKKYTFSVHPCYPHCSDPGDKTQLTDGKFSKGRFWMQKGTVGWRAYGKQISITVDLGDDRSISGVAFNTVGGKTGEDILTLKTILVSVSKNGKDFYLVGNLPELSDTMPPSDDSEYKVVKYSTNKLKTHGRYVRFTPLVDQKFCFVDEIEVFQGGPELRTISYPENTKIDFDNFLFNHRCNKRLSLNINQLISKTNSARINSKTRRELLQKLNGFKEKAKGYIPPKMTDDFKVVIPYDKMQAELIAKHSLLLKAQGFKPLTVWHKNRYAKLSVFETPRKKKPKLSLRMMQNEYRAETLNFTNATDKKMEVSFSLCGIPGTVDVRYVEYVDTREMKVTTAALMPLKKNGDNYSIRIPAGMTRQVWFTINTKGVAPGTHSGQVIIKSDDVNTSVPFALTVEDYHFPDKPRLKTGTFAYAVDYYNLTAKTRDFALKDLRDHYINVSFGTIFRMCAPPKSQFDSKGNMIGKPDFTRFDEWLKDWPDAKVYHIYCRVRETESGFAGFEIDDPRFKNAVSSWAKAWDEYVKRKGLKSGQVQMAFFDEPKTPKQYQILQKWCEAFKAGSSLVDIMNTPLRLDNHDNMKYAKEAFKHVDVICPTLKHYRVWDKTIQDYLQNLRKSGKELWLYMCFGPSRHFDPSHYRLQPWYCFDYKAVGCFFWAYLDQRCNNPWNEYDAYGGESFAINYIYKDEIIPTKHWEAFREGIEDYEYLAMLNDRLASLKKKGIKTALTRQAANTLNSTLKRVIYKTNEVTKNNSEVCWMEESPCDDAEKARLRILDMLIKLKGH